MDEKKATAWAISSSEGRSFVTTDPVVAYSCIWHSSVVPVFDEMPAETRYGKAVPDDLQKRLLARAKSDHLLHMRAN